MLLYLFRKSYLCLGAGFTLTKMRENTFHLLNANMYHLNHLNFLNRMVERFDLTPTAPKKIKNYKLIPTHFRLNFLDLIKHFV
jgi:hypothetical protein